MRGAGIDRRALVGRHAVEVTDIVPESPLSVGNGELSYTVDVTGLQTFPDRYPVEDRTGTGPGTLLATMSSWGWHSVPGSYDLAESVRVYDTPRGPVPYVDMRGELSGAGETPASAAESWLRANPHRLDLGRIGLAAAGAEPLTPADLGGVRQRLDLWTGAVASRYRLRGTPVGVTTVCHPERDVVALRIESPLLARGLAVRLAFPYGSQAWGNAADWTRPDAHTSVLRPAPGGFAVARTLDGTAYEVTVAATGGAEVTREGPHAFLVTFAEPAADLVISFRPGGPEEEPPGFSGVLEASARRWSRFWNSGGAVDLSGGGDERAPELERRIVLSQYLTAIHCAGSYPPAETGLLANSWRGRFHLEMHWWHGAHFPLWGRPELLERSLGWYAGILPVARATAAPR